MGLEPATSGVTGRLAAFRSRRGSPRDSRREQGSFALRIAGIAVR
jgi:hypothetical protein